MKTIILVGILVVSNMLLLVNENSQATALKGVPNVPWCKRRQTPKTHGCRNGSNSGGLYLVMEVEEA